MSLPFTQLYIGGEWRGSSDATTYEIRNPLTKDVVGTAASASAQDCQDAIDAAQRALTAWEGKHDGERRDILVRASELIASPRYAQKIKDALRSESCGPDHLIALNIRGAAWNIGTSAGAQSALRGETFPSATPGAHVITHRRAYGVMSVIVHRIWLIYENLNSWNCW